MWNQSVFFESPSIAASPKNKLFGCWSWDFLVATHKPSEPLEREVVFQRREIVPLDLYCEFRCVHGIPLFLKIDPLKYL